MSLVAVETNVTSSSLPSTSPAPSLLYLSLRERQATSAKVMWAGLQYFRENESLWLFLGGERSKG